MIIRSAVPSDIYQLRQLWQISFGDDEAFIDRFLHERWSGDNCLIVESGGKVASMLFLLHAEIIVEGKRTPVWYVYACATLPECRGSGFMKLLIEEAYREAILQSVFGLILVPADERLFMYYEKLNFHRLYKKPIGKCRQADFENPLVKMTDVLLEGLVNRRNASLTRELDVCWGQDHLRFVLEDCEKCSGGVQLLKEGYAIYNNTDNSPQLLEQIPEMLVGEGTVDYAMIRFCTPYDIAKISHNPYFNLGLD